jgi:Cu(I)/Ag(I) efflux system membrane fusion protein
MGTENTSARPKEKRSRRRRGALSVLLVLTAAVAGGFWFVEWNSGAWHEHRAGKSVTYHCPMHPAVVSDRPGDCPICGMRLVPMREKQEEPTAATAAGPEKKIMYRSTMNPSEISDKPGKDSMGMEMEAFEVAPSGGSAVPGLATVTLTPDARRRMGLTLGMVEKRALARTIRTSARIVADETRLFRVTTKVEGWVDRLMVAVTGEAVHKGDPLLTIYSPQLVSTQQEYLTAMQAGDAGKMLMTPARRRLQLWDVSDEQIDRLEKTGQVEKTLTLYAPAGGFVTEKNVLAGQKVMPGDSLMVVADLTVVWGEADIYESDLPYVQVGMPMELTLPCWPDKTLQGEVSFLSPSLDPQTRTLKVRLEIPNGDLLLKLDMYGIASLIRPLGEKLVVPEGAVMHTGERSYAFLDGADGRLVPVVVKVGVHSDGYYEVRSGLDEKDRVVTSANFLVDSESSMRAALEALTGR